MAPKLPIALPPVTAEYSSALQPPKPNVPPMQSAYRFTRSSAGSTRVDSGSQSVIQNPGQTIVLDHLKKTATIQPAPPPAPPIPGMPAMPHFAPPAMPGAPQAPAPPVQDLGKGVLQGHEVEGKRFLVPPPPPVAPTMPKPPGLQLPAQPALPQMPKAPAIPGMPQAPKPPAAPQTLQAPQVPGAPPPPAPPGMPQPPKPPTVTEVWTAPKLGIPMATKATGSFGQVTQVCQKAVPGEPHPGAFQIPPGYKVITLPPPPKPPAVVA